MKKIFLSILVAAAAFLGAGNAHAQFEVNFTTAPLDPQLHELAQQVLDKQLADPDGANKIFGKLMKKVGKDKEQATALGKFFLDNNVYACAKQCADAAYKCDYTYEPGLLLGVGVNLLRKKYGDACVKLDEILINNPDNIEALRLSARVYKYVNPYASKSLLEQLLEKEPDNIDAQKQMGDIAYQLEDLKGCIEPYSKFFAATPNPTIKDLLSGENYLTALMVYGKFDEIQKIVPQLEPLIDRDIDIIIPRMKFIAQMEAKNYDAASETVEYVATGRFNDSVYIDFDYVYGTQFFDEVKQDYAKAIELQKRRINLPFNKPENVTQAHLQVAQLYRSAGTPVEGIPFYVKYIDLLGEDATANKKLQLGNYFITSKDACTTPEEKAAIAQQGDAIFEEIMTLDPANPYYAMQRAALWTYDRNNPNIEAVNWYDKAVEIIEGLDAEKQEAARQFKRTALQTHLLYLVRQDEADAAEVKKFTNLLVKVDPENALAKQVKAAYKF